MKRLCVLKLQDGVSAKIQDGDIVIEFETDVDESGCEIQKNLFLMKCGSDSSDYMMRFNGRDASIEETKGYELFNEYPFFNKAIDRELEYRKKNGLSKEMTIRNI